MSVKTLIIVFGAALILMGTATAGEKQEENTGKTYGPPVKLFELKTTCDRLSHSVDLWHDANLKGNEDAVVKYFDEMLVMIDQDIVASRRMLKLFAQQRLLEHATNDVEQRNLLENRENQAELDADRKAIEQLAALINTKTAVRDAIGRSDVFSNKYRLLGDYINLLRKELNIPKVKMAYKMAGSSVGLVEDKK
jgi:hypothetical protein